jgi:hypothetical protein
LNRGTCAGLAAFACPSTLPRGQRPPAPFRAESLIHRSTSRPRKALRLSSVASPRCCESASTNRRSRHEHSRQTSPLETARRAPWETRQRSTSRQARDGGVSAVSSRDCAGPPCGHPASSGHVLDGTPPASARSTATLAQARVGGGSGALSAAWSAVDASLWHLSWAAGSGRRSAFSRSHEPVRTGRTSMQPALPSPRCLPPSKAGASPLSGARAARCTRWPAGAAAALFHRGSKTPTRPLFARCRGRLQGRARFYGFCK